MNSKPTQKQAKTSEKSNPFLKTNSDNKQVIKPLQSKKDNSDIRFVVSLQTQNKTRRRE